jgi:hypothetical protein
MRSKISRRNRRLAPETLTGDSDWSGPRFRAFAFCPRQRNRRNLLPRETLDYVLDIVRVYRFSGIAAAFKGHTARLLADDYSL